MGSFSIGTVVVLVIVVLVIGWTVSAQRQRQQVEDLMTTLSGSGWTSPDPSEIPAAIAPAAASRRSQVFVTRQVGQRQLWVSWHRWTETRTVPVASGSSVSGMGQRTETTVRHLTRVWTQVPGLPNLQVVGRTWLGGLLMARRGVGTGDDEFDRKFAIKPSTSAAAAIAVNTQVRELLLGLRVGGVSILDGLLCVSYGSPLTSAVLQPRIDTTISLAEAFAGPGRTLPR